MQSSEADAERQDVFSRYDGWGAYDDDDMDIPPTEYRKFKRLANEMFLSVDHSSETAAEDLTWKRKHIFELKHGDKYKGFPQMGNFATASRR